MGEVVGGEAACRSPSSLRVTSRGRTTDVRQQGLEIGDWLLAIDDFEREIAAAISLHLFEFAASLNGSYVSLTY